MSSDTERSPETLISFDLNQVLKPEEIKEFTKAARRAGAKSLTEHFLNITLRMPQKKAA